MPTYIKLSFIDYFFAKYGKVIDVERETFKLICGTEEKDVYNGIIHATMDSTEEQIQEIPYLVNFDNDLRMLITIPGRAPFCLKCHTVGHVKRHCPQNTRHVKTTQSGDSYSRLLDQHVRRM